MRVKYLILGAGPTGLGAAHRLKELGEESFAVLEKEKWPGGLAASFKDSAGFTWDIGGHVVFSHYEYFDHLLDSLLEGQYLEHQRVSTVRVAGGWVPYPFQNNIRYLPKHMAWECISGLMPENRPCEAPGNFQQWIDHVFGAGIARVFMNPYNYKVWATPPRLMDYRWIGERVSVIDLAKVLENYVLQKDDKAWGPNSVFRFPKTGGTGEIFQRLARRLGDRLHLGREVLEVDAEARIVRTSEGLEYEYEKLLNTAALDLFVDKWLKQSDEPMREAAGLLEHNGVFVGGVGLETMRQDNTCWMYFPEDNCPFYRVTNFHNYSPYNTAIPGSQRAFMCETSFSKHKKEDITRLLDDTVTGLINGGLMDENDLDDVATRFEYVADYGYPVPTLGRDRALAAIQPRLEDMDIYSRGRFGGWKYEVSNMDHSVMQGVEWAQRMVLDQAETTYKL